MDLHATDWFTITGRGTVAAITTPHPNPAELKGQTVTIDGKQYRVRGVEQFYPRKATSPYGLLVTPIEDGFMSCPCGRGDYHLCTDCPYDWCSTHGQADTSPHPPTHCNPRNTTAPNTGTEPSPATNDHEGTRDALHDREH